MNVLVTGGSGFLGSQIVRRLCLDGHTVRCFQRSIPAAPVPGADWIQGSITDLESVVSASRGCDAIINVAAKAGVWGDPSEYFDVNVRGTENVIVACNTNCIRFLVHTSTPSVVFSGSHFEGANESLPYGRCIPCDYPATKVLAEKAVLMASVGGLSTCALRPHLLWGDGDPHLAPRILRRAAEGRLRIVGKATNRVDITHVENAATAHVLALEALTKGRAAGKPYFISDGEPVNLWERINGLLASHGLKTLTRRVPYPLALLAGSLCEWLWRTTRRQSEPPMTRFVATQLARSHWFSIERARDELGYTPRRHSAESWTPA